MNQKNTDLIRKMNLQTDAIIGNQCDQNEVVHYDQDGCEYTYYSFNERGVGQNRNTALFRADADILVFSDEDMIFVDGYSKIIQNAYTELPDADGIIFNIETIGGEAQRRENRKVKRIRPWNFMNYGAARLSVRNISIRRENICFHREFGGGTRYSSGEDTLFIGEMLKKGLKLYTYPVTIGQVDQETSTWFRGYNEKYFYDKGALYKALLPEAAGVLCMIMLLKHWKTYRSSGLTMKKAAAAMAKGRKGFKMLIPYSM